MKVYTKISDLIYQFAEKQTGTWNIIKDEDKGLVRVEYRRRLKFVPFTEYLRALDFSVLNYQGSDYQNETILNSLKELRDGLNESILDSISE